LWGTQCVRIIQGDALAVVLPEGPVVLFYFNSFEREMMEMWLARMGEIAAVRRWPLDLIYVHPEFDGLVRGGSGVARWPVKRFDSQPRMRRRMCSGSARTCARFIGGVDDRGVSPKHPNGDTRLPSKLFWEVPQIGLTFRWLGDRKETLNLAARDSLFFL